MTIQFPQSRTNSNGQCQECKSGADVAKEAFMEQDVAGNDVEILQTTCTYCGHIKRYDLTVVRKATYKNRAGADEVLPAIALPGEVKAF